MSRYDGQTSGQHDDQHDVKVTYEHLGMHGQSYVCSIPQVETVTENKTQEQQTKAEQEKDLVQAADRGWQLLQDMGGKPCLFYTTGWWSYSFCYNSQVKQFHSLSMGGARVWPPQEDPTTPTYVLGKFDPKAKGNSVSAESSKREVVQIQSQAETNYLVQRLDGGTPCDLTGKDRKVEVQFHCHPQSTDRIGWIKETATCSYVMVIYTPRLCNDVAFMPPKESQAHSITCQQVLMDDEIEQWEASHKPEAERQTIEQDSEQQMVVGNIEIGARKYLGKDGKKIERGRVVMTAEEKAETVIMQKDGQIQGLSKSKLKELDLNPEEVESFRKELQKLAGKKDWKIERLDDVNGNIQLRGIVATEDKDGGKKSEKTQGTENSEDQEGSEEEYKEEV